MAKDFLIGNSNNIAKKPSKILVGNSSNIAKEVKAIFVGDSNNKAVKVYPNGHGLPSTFQECEYIFNSGGTQYIDLGFKANSDTSVSMDVMFTKSFPHSYDPLYDQPMFGVLKYGRTSDGYLLWQNIYYMYVYENIFYFIFGGNGTQGSQSDEFSLYFTANERYVIEMKNKHFLVNEQDKGSSNKTFSDTYANMLIFGGYSSTENQNFVLHKMPEGMRLYHFRAQTYSGTLIRDMYPCYMKSSSLNAGMYDLVSKTFYGNSGTGYFDKGPNVG